MTSRTETSNNKSRYSWAVRVDVVLDSRGGFKDYAGGSVSLLWQEEGLVLRLERRNIAPWLESAGATGYRLTAEATETACEAEALGCRITAAILSVALKKHWGLTLSWPDSPLPCRVVDRTVSRGITAHGFGTVTSHVDFEELTREFDAAFASYAVVEPRLLLSLELCAASRCESSSRSRLVMLVSAVEAVAEQRDLGDEVAALVKELVSCVEGASVSDDAVKRSITGQVQHLQRESARRAMLRLFISLGFKNEERELVEEAYSARSKIVHEGARVPGLDGLVIEVDRLVVEMHSRAAQQALAADVAARRR